MTDSMGKFRNLLPGEPAPCFVQRSTSSERYNFDTVGGRYVVLAFFASATVPEFARVVELLRSERALFDDEKLAFFGISNDPNDELQQRLQPSYPGIRFFWDFDGTVARLYGSLPVDAPPAERVRKHRLLWVIVDPMLRIHSVIPFQPDAGDLAEVRDALTHLPALDRFAGTELQAPVLYLPRVFEPELCAELIAHYERAGGKDSGFMRQHDGKTVMAVDYEHKRRMDYVLEDDELRQLLWNRFERKIFPEIKKAFQFSVSRMERFLVACYESSQRGHFRPHRDNTTAGTAHRRFAVSINLNEDFVGGELHFPEYSPKAYRPAVGCAVVFSCSLLHSVDPVVAGRRFAFLPFLYDEAAVAVRLANNVHLAPDVPAYSPLDEPAR
jgi:peroxiredoxin/predicted 2-oxoglutarate/Fe(II)-dependent dioxygenase YbiX